MLRREEANASLFLERSEVVIWKKNSGLNCRSRRRGRGVRERREKGMGKKVKIWG